MALAELFLYKTYSKAVGFVQEFTSDSGAKQGRMRKQEIEVQKLARSQHGNNSWHQLQRLGVSRRQIMRRVSSGEWVRELPGVWRLGWADATWMQRAWCAALWGSEALISHRAAARLWELDCIKAEA